ncbi:uncharacterized protein LOC142166958 [Nicotiana tabacum]|uniref:Uncharacterized protein LOC142166958 n=1 Tax=Nicotiana tabacum TaxID=4097 RepID=A0AC58SDL3_TOBAC
MNTVSPNLLSYIVYTSNAHLVWEDLREQIDKVNRMRIFQLHREIETILQGTDSVSMYFTRLKELWAEYDAMVPSPNLKDYVDHIQQQRLLQFLSGLNDTYSQARRQILMKLVESTLNQAYAMIVEDETHKATNTGLNPVVDGNDITALWSAKAHQQKPKRNYNIQCEISNLKAIARKITIR